MEGRPLNITITTGTVLKTLLIVVGAWALYTLRDIMLNVLTSVVIASAIEPGVNKMVRNKIPRVLAVICIYLILLAGLFCGFYFFLPLMLSEVASFVAALPQYLAAFSGSEPFSQYSQLFGGGAFTPDGVMSGVRQALNFGGVFDNTLTAVSAVFGGVFSFIFIIVFSFYFTVANTGMETFIDVVAPSTYREYLLDLWQRSREKIGLWMQGQLLLGLIMGVLVYLGLTILGVEHAFILGIIAAAFELIPVFGPTLSAVPAVAIAFASGGTSLGLLTIALYVIAQQFENHLIYPLVVTRVVGVSPLLIILALLVGAELAGFLGIILSVPISATVQEFVNDLRARRVFASAPEDLGAV